MDKTSEIAEYFLLVARTPSHKSNLFLGHAAPAFTSSKDRDKVHIANFGSAALPKYKPHVPEDKAKEAHNHFWKQSLPLAITSSLGLGILGYVAGQDSPLLAKAVLSLGGALTGTFSSLMYAGYRTKPGALIIEEPDHERDKELNRSYYKIKITPEQYKAMIKNIEAKTGEQPFSTWRNNCARLTLTQLEKADQYNGQNPDVKRSIPLRVFNITTPRYVEHVMEDLVSQGIAEQIDINPENSFE